MDTSVWLLAVGEDHVDRAVCRRLVSAADEGMAVLHSSVEAVQEFAFHRLRRTDRAVALDETMSMRAAAILHDFDQDTLDRTLRLMASTTLRGRDAVHAATALRAGFDQIVTLNADFDGVPGLTSIHPTEVA